MPTPGRKRSVVDWRFGSLLSASKAAGWYSRRASPWKLFVPDLVTPLTMKPPVRPLSAVTPLRVMLTSWMSSSAKSW